MHMSHRYRVTAGYLGMTLPEVNLNFILLRYLHPLQHMPPPIPEREGTLFRIC